MKSKLHLILTAGLFLLPALPLHASVDSILTLTLNGYYQKKLVTDGAQVAGNVDIVRIDSKQLLILLEKELGVNLPQGAQLKVMTDGKVFAATPKGVLLNDVSAYIVVTMDDSVRLMNGHRSLATGQENTRNYYPITITFNLTALQGTIKGVLIENLVVGAPDRYGFHVANEKSSSSVNGSGTYAGKLTYFDGTLRLMGRASQ